MNINERILITGSTGLAGSAVLRSIFNRGYTNIIATYRHRDPACCFDAAILGSRHCQFIKIDLLNQREVKKLFEEFKPQYVFLAAARVGGIMANYDHSADFIYENLQIQNNVIHSSFLAKVKKLIFLGSTCIYPTRAPQPMKEEYLMTDTLEYLSEPYGVAKIAGLKMCERYNMQYGTNFLSVMPTNLYGPNDNYDLRSSHFLPAFIRKMHLGKCLMEDDWNALRDDLKRNPIDDVSHLHTSDSILEMLSRFGISKVDETNKIAITLWGTGNPRREILHADELAHACVFIMNTLSFQDVAKVSASSYSEGIVKDEIRNTHINIGLGYDFSLFEIAQKVKAIVGFSGEIIWDPSMPDGTFQKLTDISRAKEFGWKSMLSLEDGIQSTYQSYLEKANMAQKATLNLKKS